MYFKAIILGIVQGITEFLPVSSSGHLVLLGKLGLGEDSMSLFFNIMLHIGTLFAVMIVFRKKIWYLIKHPKSKETKMLVWATIPTVVIALIMKIFFEDLIQGKLLALGFMGTSVLLVLAQISKPKGLQLNYKNSFLTGLVQGIAVLPGISRSGSTISCLMMQGVDRKEAGEFSFLLSIPVILGSALVECLDMSISSFNVPFLPILVGMIFSFGFGMLSIKFFLKLIKKANFVPFAIYTFILAIICVVLL